MELAKPGMAEIHMESRKTAQGGTDLPRRGRYDLGGFDATITGAASATVTRDLADLVAKQALTKTGERKATRYFLNIPVKPVAKVSVMDIL